MAEKVKLTAAQRRALTVARDKGHAFAGFGMGSRAGGAYSRMCDRLVEQGFLTRAPHAITPAGRSLLASLDKQEEIASRPTQSEP